MNKDLRYLRRWLGRRKGTTTPKAAFRKGDVVQVRHGVVHDQYPDIPLGGWVGRIKRIGWLTPIGYAVHWTKPTLDQAHAVFFKRCQRDGLSPIRYWLEEDQLRRRLNETPVAMEQPTKIITRPLSMDDQDDHIRMIFGLTSDDVLPKADELTQQQFFDYLKAKLSFPFKADVSPCHIHRSGCGWRGDGDGFCRFSCCMERWVSCARPEWKEGSPSPFGGPSR